MNSFVGLEFASGCNPYDRNPSRVESMVRKDVQLATYYTKYYSEEEKVYTMKLPAQRTAL